MMLRVLGLLLALLLPGIAEAQFVRTDCTTLTGVFTVGTTCSDATRGLFYQWNGAAFVPLTLPITSQLSAFGINGAAQGGYLLSIGGTWTPTNAGAASGLLVSTAVHAAANQIASIATVSSPTGITKAASGTHSTFATLQVDDLKIQAGAATLTNAYTLVVGGAPTPGMATNTGVSWFEGPGGNRFDSDGTYGEIILNRTAGGPGAQLTFARSLAAGAYVGITATDDLGFLDKNAVERMRLYTSSSGGLSVGTNNGDPGAGGIAMAGKLTGVTKISLTPFVFANIATILTANGDLAYCSDCNIANPCTGGGTGAIAKRLNGANVCN